MPAFSFGTCVFQLQLKCLPSKLVSDSPFLPLPLLLLSSLSSFFFFFRLVYVIEIKLAIDDDNSICYIQYFT